MEEEVSFLRRKVNRLEDMIYNLNDKIGLILEKFLNHRASHVAGIREVLQVEEDICLSLVTQLKSSIISSSSNNRSEDRNSAGKADKKASTQTRSNAASTRQPSEPAADARRPTTAAASVSLPRVVLTRQAKSPTTSSKRTKTTPNKKRGQVTDDEYEASDPAEDPLVGLENTEMEQENSNSNMFTINVKTEDQDQNDFQQDGGLDVNLDEGPCNSNSSDEEEEDEESDKDDPDFVEAGSGCSTSANPNPNPRAAFIVSRSFASLDEAKAQIKADFQFRVKSKMYTSTGTKLYYNCRHDRKCPVKMHLSINEETGAVDEYLSPDPPPHLHNQKLNQGRGRKGGLATEVKAAVDEIYLRGPRLGGGGGRCSTVDKLHEELIRRGFQERAIPKHKIRNYMTSLKRQRFGDLSFMRQPPKTNKTKKTPQNP